MSDSIDKLELVDRLINKSREALLCAIELHNKPKLSYRYETTTVLIVNAWELLLKAFLVKNNGVASIFEKDGEHTIGIISLIDTIKTIIGKGFDSIAKSLETIVDYRNKVIHFNNTNINPLLYGILSKNIDNFILFLQTNFDTEPSWFEDFNTLPLVFSINKTPLDLIQAIKNDENENEKLREFINNLVVRVRQCDVKDAIFYDIDVKLQSIKKIDNADLVVAIDNNSPIKINTTKTYRLSSDKDAQKVSLTDAEVFELYPYSYSSLTKEASNRYYFTQNTELHRKIKMEIEADVEACYLRENHPQKRSGKDKFFSEKAFSVYEKYCRRKQI